MKSKNSGLSGLFILFIVLVSIAVAFIGGNFITTEDIGLADVYVPQYSTGECKVCRDGDVSDSGRVEKFTDFWGRGKGLKLFYCNDDKYGYIPKGCDFSIEIIDYDSKDAAVFVCDNNVEMIDVIDEWNEFTGQVVFKSAPELNGCEIYDTADKELEHYSRKTISNIPQGKIVYVGSDAKYEYEMEYEPFCLLWEDNNGKKEEFTEGCNLRDAVNDNKVKAMLSDEDILQWGGNNQVQLITGYQPEYQSINIVDHPNKNEAVFLKISPSGNIQSCPIVEFDNRFIIDEDGSLGTQGCKVDSTFMCLPSLTYSNNKICIDGVKLSGSECEKGGTFIEDGERCFYNCVNGKKINTGECEKVVQPGPSPPPIKSPEKDNDIPGAILGIIGFFIVIILLLIIIKVRNIKK